MDVVMKQPAANMPTKNLLLDKHLDGKTYLVAEQFSLAEVCYMPFPGFPATNGNRSSASSCVVEPAPTRAAERRCHSAGEVAQRQPADFPIPSTNKTNAPIRI